ncbi:MAG: tRNA lysidine(34) synthetase TilS, partial [Planctomycetota bacterium]
AGRVARSRVRALHLTERYRLWHALARALGCEGNRAHLHQLEDLARGAAGRSWDCGAWRFTATATALWWYRRDRPHPLPPVALRCGATVARGSARIYCAEHPRVDGLPRAASQQALCDAARIEGPLIWRAPQPGERWRPLGSPGRKRIRRHLAEHGVPAALRDQQDLIADAAGPVWVPGLGIAARVALAVPTRRVLVLRREGALAQQTWAAPSPDMQHDDVTAVILAAGRGTRMGSDMAKVLHPVGGRTMVAHVVDTCLQVGVGRCVVVVGHQREAVCAAVAGEHVDCVTQEEQLGTGHAVLVCAEAVSSEVVLVLCGDAPLVPAALLEQLLARHRAAGNACTCVAARMPDPSGYGRMITDATGQLTAIVEQRDATAEQRRVDLVNSGIYAFDRAELFASLERLRPENAQGEYYLTDVPRLLAERGKPVGLVVSDEPDRLLGVNTPEDLARAEDLYQAG